MKTASLENRLTDVKEDALKNKTLLPIIHEIDNPKSMVGFDESKHKSQLGDSTISKVRFLIETHAPVNGKKELLRMYYQYVKTATFTALYGTGVSQQDRENAIKYREIANRNLI